MAKKGGKKGEHQMLFDLQSGKRRVVVKVVYAVLAVLMGLSLLLIAGPLPFGDIFGSEDAQEQAQDQFEEKAQRIEAKLVKDPENPELLIGLTRAYVSAGSNLSEVGPNGEIGVTEEARQEYEKAASAWDEYLEATDKPTSGSAQLMANTLFTLAQTSPSNREAEANIKATAEAQQIVADQRPTLNSLSTLGLYLAYTFDYAAARKATEEAKKFASSKFQREQLDNQLEEVEKRAREFEKAFKEEEQLSKSLQESRKKEGAEGGGTFTNPFGGGAALSE